MKSLNTVHKKNQNDANKSYGIDWEISKTLWATELFFLSLQSLLHQEKQSGCFLSKCKDRKKGMFSRTL